MRKFVIIGCISVILLIILFVFFRYYYPKNDIENISVYTNKIVSIQSKMAKLSVKFNKDVTSAENNSDMFDLYKVSADFYKGINKLPEIIPPKLHNSEANRYLINFYEDFLICKNVRLEAAKEEMSISNNGGFITPEKSYLFNDISKKSSECTDNMGNNLIEAFASLGYDIDFTKENKLIYFPKKNR
jgi:hypothetical protein